MQIFIELKIWQKDGTIVDLKNYYNISWYDFVSEDHIHRILYSLSIQTYRSWRYVYLNIHF